MPTLESWMVLTIRIPFWGVLLGVGISLVLIVFASFWLRQRAQYVKMLTRRTEELKRELESLKIEGLPVSAEREAYLQFTHHISHEVSNPLQSVQTNLENMAECSPEEIGRWKQYYVIIKQEIKRLFTLTENLRLLSQLERVGGPVKREPVNLKGVIEDVIMAQAERASAKNMRLRYQGPNRPAKVLGNREYLYQLIINLVDNSIKYSKESGGEIIINLSEEYHYARVIIVDDGIGIPQEDLPYVFDTAYRSRNRGNRTGSGLGLAIVKRIVDQHEGKIGVDSLVGQGTTMTVELPIYNPAYQG
jgi:two-component system phosphate regulon sensor histidine kinase PhoR